MNQKNVDFAYFQSSTKSLIRMKEYGVEIQEKDDLKFVMNRSSVLNSQMDGPREYGYTTVHHVSWFKKTVSSVLTCFGTNRTTPRYFMKMNQNNIHIECIIHAIYYLTK